MVMKHITHEARLPLPPIYIIFHRNGRIVESCWWWSPYCCHTCHTDASRQFILFIAEGRADVEQSSGEVRARTPRKMEPIRDAQPAACSLSHATAHYLLSALLWGGRPLHPRWWWGG